MARAAKWTVTLAVLLVAAVLALYLRKVDLAEGGGTFLPRCSLNHFTGLHCPGCGNTRAAQALLHGDLAGAIRQNVVFVVALPFLLLGAARTWYGWMYPGRLRPLLPFDWKWSWSLVIIGGVLAFSVLRNIPAQPFSWLAPVPIGAGSAAPPITANPPAGRAGPDRAPSPSSSR